MYSSAAPVGDEGESERCSVMEWIGAEPLAIPLANSAKLFRAQEGRRKLAGGGAPAQPPVQVEKDCSRPGRDAGPKFATGPIPVRRPFRAHGPVVAFPVATLRSATG